MAATYDGTPLVRKDGKVSKVLTDKCRKCGMFDPDDEVCCDPESTPQLCDDVRPRFTRD